jgi:hypothetical protein
MTLAAAGGLCLGLVLGWLSAYRSVLISRRAMAAAALSLPAAAAAAWEPAGAWTAAAGWLCGWGGAAAFLWTLAAR